MSLLPGAPYQYQGPYGGGFGAPPAPQAGGFQGLLRDPNFALALLANSRGQSFGQAIGNAGLQTQQIRQQQEDSEFQRAYRTAQLEQMKNHQPQGPASIAEYEYAVKNGFKGSFQDWIVAGGQSSRPSSVQEWEFYDKLPPEQKPLYLEMKRNPNFVVKDVNQVPTSIQQSIVGGVTSQPLSTLQQTVAAAETVKQAEGRGGAVGKAQGEITGGVLTKGSNARSTLATLDLADPLIDAATGSSLGAGRDKLLAFFGSAPDSAQAIAQLRVLQANLMTTMPRMEGPQSDRDVELYRQAAGQIGDPSVPAPLKKAAVKTIRSLQEKYQERASELSAPPSQTPGAPSGGRETAAERAKRLGL